MKVVVGGGSGFVGKSLCSLLRRRGHEVVIVSRAPIKSPVDGCDVMTWDSLKKDGIPSGTTAAVNLAGANILDPLKRWGSYASVVRQSRLDTTKDLVTAISHSLSPPTVFVSASAIGYYPSSPTADYDEESVCVPSNFIEQLVHDWEDAATLPPEVETRLVKVRIGVVLGKGGGIVQNMWLPFYLGGGGPVGSGKQWFPWVHIDDVAGVFLHAIENEHVKGTLNAVAPTPASNAEFASAFGAAMWRPAFIPLPGFVVNTVFGSERGAIMLEGQKVNPKKTLESGYEFEYPHLKEACEQCVA